MLVLNSDPHAAAHHEAQAAQCGQCVVGMFPLLIVHLQPSSDDRAVATGHRGLQSEDRKLSHNARDRVRRDGPDRKINREHRRAAIQGPSVFMLHLSSDMLKLLGSYALAKLLGFGLVGAIVIYALLRSTHY